MKILHLLDSFDYTDGCARQVFLLAREQTRKGHEIIVAFGDGEGDRLLEDSGIQHVAMDAIAHRRRSAGNFVRGVIRLRTLVKSFRPDIIHAHHFYVANQVRVVRKKRYSKLVQTVHSGANFEGKLSQFVGDAIIAVSANTRDLIILKKPQLAGRVSVIRNSSEFLGAEAPVMQSQSFQHLLSVKSFSFIVGYVGRIEEEKGIWILVDALKALTNHMPILFCVVGKGSCYEKMNQRTRDAGIGTIFFGEVENVRPVLEQCDILVVPSNVIEGYPMVLIEAGMLGKPVVASNVGGISEIIEHGKSGLLVTAGDIRELADAVRALHESKAMRERLGAELQQTVSINNSVTTMTDAVEAVYRSLRGN